MTKDTPQLLDRNEIGPAHSYVVINIFFLPPAQNYATPAPAPEKIEVFVNDKSLLVDPGITVLQVRLVWVRGRHILTSLIINKNGIDSQGNVNELQRSILMH